MKPLFIHIPKAAGMVIQKIVENLNEDMGPSNEVCLHKRLQDIENRIVIDTMFFRSCEIHLIDW